MVEYTYIDRSGYSIKNEGFETILNDDGDRKWYLDGKLHREDGPAIESGLSKNLWYLHGVRLYEPQIKLLKHLFSCSHKELVLQVHLGPPYNHIITRRLANNNYKSVSIKKYPMKKHVQNMLTRDLY